jgi:CheY-like chemotaxis protein
MNTYANVVVAPSEKSSYNKSFEMPVEFYNNNAGLQSPLQNQASLQAHSPMQSQASFQTHSPMQTHQSPLQNPIQSPIQTQASLQNTSLSNSIIQNPSSKPSWSAPPKVLLVEDDDTCRRLSSKLLQLFGCSFDIAVDGVDAVNRMCGGLKYDIVLMDIVMPNMDGVSATTRIRQFDQSTPIISMTSNITETDCMNYLANGMNDILAKPFNRSSLLGMISRYFKTLLKF